MFVKRNKKKKLEKVRKSQKKLEGVGIRMPLFSLFCTIGGVNGGVNLDFWRSKSNFRFPPIQYPGSRTNQIAESQDIPLRTLQRELSRLKGAGQIEFRGAPKNGGYFVK